MNRSAAWQLWAIGALLPLAMIITGDFGRYDFAAFWVAALQTVSGQVGDIYSTASTQFYADRFGLGPATIFPYPPHALLIFLPVALLPYMPAYLAWDALGLSFFLWCARPWWPKGLPLVLAILTPAAIICLDFGQTGLVFGGLWLLAFRDGWGAVALLTFKPHLGLLSALSLRGWPAVAKTAALAGLLVLASLLLFGPDLWLKFVDQAVRQSADIGVRKRWLFAGVAPAIGYGFIGWLPFALAGGLLLARRVNVFTAATASFLISPYGFHYDMTVASMGFGLLAYRHWDGMPVRHRLPVALGFLSPVIASAGAWWVPPLLLWALWAQVRYDIRDEGFATSRD